ncbi:MAG: MFS transporter [Sphingomonas phyllosphaerae]|uniref:MFS transporter n=1 Tax=Sphingomonas phyllosphaerae TaxID=257003 RepID=UPI002FFC0549
MVRPLPPGYRLLAAFSLAHAGVVIGYLPFLSLLLPLKVDELAGDARIGWLTVAVVLGAGMASGANIFFGWLSDRHYARGGGRRGWIAGGLIALTVSYAGIALAAQPATLIVAVLAFQLAVNAVLAPMMAIMADEIPDDQRGLAGGLLAIGPPAAGAVSALLVADPHWNDAARFALIVGLTLATVVPLLAIRRPPVPAAPVMRDAAPAHRLWVASLSRLLVQLAGGALSLYLLYYFQSIVGAVPPATLAARVGTLLTISYILPLPVAVFAGRLSDQAARRTPFLFGAAIAATLGLLAMATLTHPIGAAIGFLVYSVAAAVFLALHQAFAVRLLPDPRHRGRDLGIINLSNTVPSLLGPLLTWALATPGDFTPLLLVLAALTLAGGVLILPLRRGKRR